MNTLKRDGDGWYGDNTDGAGIVRDLTHNLGVALAGRDVLVLGAGGAARGIMSSAARRAPALADDQQPHDRQGDASSRELFAPHGPIAAVPPEALAGRAFDIVINATSAGLADDGAAAVAAVDRGLGRVRLRHDLRRCADGVPALGASRMARRGRRTAWAC